MNDEITLRLSANDAAVLLHVLKIEAREGLYDYEHEALTKIIDQVESHESPETVKG